MLRTLLLILVLSTPTSLAAPIVTVAWTPGGVTLDDADAFYLKVTLSEPEPPTEGPASANDCSYGDRPADTLDGIRRTADGLAGAASGPTPFSAWFPTCVAVPLAGGVYASYDIARGRYYVESPDLVPSTGGQVGVMSESGVTGTTGAEVEADCVTCPQPP